jgi:hypothetical protein
MRPPSIGSSTIDCIYFLPNQIPFLLFRMVIPMTRCFGNFSLLLAFVCLMLVCRFDAAGQNLARGRVTLAAEHNWSATPSGELSQPGNNAVSLPSCPPGVSGHEPEYWVLIDGARAGGPANPEAVKVTGGSCAGDGRPGTLQFVTAKTHPAGYTVSSASSGLQEALIAARFSPTNPAGSSQSGTVIVPPGEYKAYARVSVRGSNLTVDFSGSIVECWMDDVCIFVGDPKNSILFQDITLISPRGRPTIKNGQKPFIEVNALKTRLFNVSTRNPLQGGTFGNYVQVDDDEAFLLDGLDTSLGAGGLRCDATVCNPAVYAPGPFTGSAAVGWLKNLNISLGCDGNGVDWQSGNTVRISDSVVQGYSQYGVRAGTRRGGYGGFDVENVYEEVGNCSNPMGKLGQAGVIAQGGTVRIRGGEAPTGWIPYFASTGNLDYRYYIVARHAKFGASNPLYAGRAKSSGSGNITVTTPDIAGAATFDLLRVSPTPGLREQAPFGSGDYAVLTNVGRGAACAHGICTFTDTQAALHSYNVAAPTYFPMLEFWPGSLVLGASLDSNSVLAGARAWVDLAPSSVAAVQGTIAPALVATSCDALAGWTPLWVSCYSAMAPSTFPDQGALVMAVKPNADAGLRTGLKGRLNFSTLGTGPGHIITLSDSNFQKTIATANNRPSSDASDAFVGYDQGDGNSANVGISLGAPKSISSYIGNAGDGKHWLERLSENLKSFKVPITTDSKLISTLPPGTPPFSVASSTPVANLTLSNHPRMQACGTTTACSANPVTDGQIVFGSVTLAHGEAIVKGFSPGFKAVDSFQCTASDKTSAANAANAVAVSGSSIVVRGTANDVIAYMCAGS